jgi:hypothetical protein
MIARSIEFGAAAEILNDRVLAALPCPPHTVELREDGIALDFRPALDDPDKLLAGLAEIAGPKHLRFFESVAMRYVAHGRGLLIPHGTLVLIDLERKEAVLRPACEVEQARAESRVRQARAALEQAELELRLLGIDPDHTP